jgi:hypothetical protein
MHYPDGLVEPRGRSWRILSDPQHQQTRYRTLNHRTSITPPLKSAKSASPPAPPSPVTAQAPVIQRPVPEARAIQLTDKDVLDLKKTLQTEWVAFAGNDQAYGIIDTILNRLASGRWGNTIASVVNAKNQFSGINGPPSRSGKDHIGIGSHNAVEQIPASYIANRTNTLADNYLAERAKGRKSIVGTHLDYANPDPRYSTANNLAWINKLSGPSFGKGSAVHRHGTTVDKERYRPKPFYILLPAKSG